MKRHALFVGVDSYADRNIQDLHCAVNDATELAGFFKHRARFDRAEALPNPRACNDVLERVHDLLDGLGPGDEFLFFFAGHGIKTQDGHRLVCAGDFRRQDGGFVRGRHHGRPTKFNLRGIYATDSSTIQLAYWCIDWAKHRQRKAAVKIHMVANVANRLPHFCVFGRAKDHDGKMEDELFNSLKEGDIGIADRAYNHFKALHRQSLRGVFFVVREKSGMKYRVVRRVAKKDLGENIISDETIMLTGQRTSKEYPCAMRRVVARVKVDGKWRTMVFLTNNFEWAASTIAELYKARWEVELLFKELKQTLQLQDFYGENENAVAWQIWAALLTHLVLRWLKYKSGAACGYSRFAALVRAIVWLKKDAMAILRSYGIAPPPDPGGVASGMPYLPGFEKMSLKSVG